jgi:Protein of unknown function (DUF2612)
MTGTWDDGETWDSGGLWDFTATPADYSIEYYYGYITSEYNQQPDFLTVIAVSVQPFSDTILLLKSLPNLFVLDSAVGDQLTKLGELIGVPRYVQTPITGIYFSLDSATLGLDQGSMQGEFDPSSGLTALPDDIYLALVKAQILLNVWDGTIPRLYAALNPLLSGLVIQDFGNGSMFYGLTTAQSKPILTQLFLDGYFNLAPAGIQVLPPKVTTPNNTPFFGLAAANTSAIAGLDIGYMI